MAKHDKGEPTELVRRHTKEVAAVEQYWDVAERPKPHKPPKDYKYVEELAHLQFELIKLQEWVRLQKLKVVVIFEGRDSAGKGGVIKRITQRLNPQIAAIFTRREYGITAPHGGLPMVLRQSTRFSDRKPEIYIINDEFKLKIYAA